MPWLLSFTGGSGTSGAISHPAVLSGATSFDVEIDFVPRVVSTGYTPVFSNNDGGASTRHAMYLWGGSRAEIAFIIGGARRVINSPAGTFAAGTRYKVNVVYNGSTLQMLVNGTSVASTAATGTVGGASGLNTIGANLTETRPQIDLYGYKITENGALVRNYDPSASGGTGTVLPELINSANNGTQIGIWPANNDEWVFYSSGGTPFSGTLGKTSLTPAAKTLAISVGWRSNIVKTNAVVSPDQLGVTLGAVNVLSKNSYNVALKQLSLTVGVNLPFAGLLTKTNYPVSNKQLGVVSGVSANIGRQALSILPKPLTVSAGFRAGVQKQQLNLSGKQEGVSIGHLLSINEQHLTIQNKQLQLVTGTSVSFLGVLNKTALNASPKQLGVLAGTNVPVNLTLNKSSLILSPKQLSITTGTSLPFNGTLVKTSYNLSGKTLSSVAGTVLTLQKQALEIVSKQFSMGDTIYPIIPIERVFTFTDKNNRTYVFKQTTNVYVMNN
jgi:hypothetical protein